MKFTYASGQKPLPGYTIKHSIGKGAFGEVYFGLSDGGKEVALKLIRDNLDIELRGVAQCLNLKDANLVHLYDLRTDERGDHWLIMEYVEGESLRAILDRHPQGVAPELAAQWFAGLAEGVQHLHEHGIVHRDLKPGNIFLEKGKIKVGDYSLCKLIGSQRAGQTQSVGTVLYMAPEISTGNYNRQVDIYAAGIILYEMLTGRVPFDGDSAGEILMKHLTSMPDLSKVPSPFVPILSQALSKNPSHRFSSIAEMGRKVAQTQEVNKGTNVPRLPLNQAADAPRSPETERSTLPQEPWQSLTPAPTAPTQTPFVELAGALLYSALLCGVGSLALSTLLGDGDWSFLARMFFPSVLCSWLVLAVCKRWSQPMEESVARRLTLLSLGLLLGLVAMWLDGFPLPWPHEGGDARVPSTDAIEHTLPKLGRYLGYFGLLFLLLRWWKLTELRRTQRFNVQAVVATAIWAGVLLLLLPRMELKAMSLFFAPPVLASVIVQVVSPWEKRAPARSKRLRLPWA